MFFRNVGELSDYTASHPSRWYSLFDHTPSSVEVVRDTRRRVGRSVSLPAPGSCLRLTNVSRRDFFQFGGRGGS
jgi:hypothetical protein